MPAKSEIWLRLAQNSSRSFKVSRPVRCSIGLAEMSMTRSLVLWVRPERVVSALWEMWSSSRLESFSRPVISRNLFAWIERIVRLERLSRPFAVYG